MDAQEGVPTDADVDAGLDAVLAAGVYEIAYDVAFPVTPFDGLQAIGVDVALPESEACFVGRGQDGELGTGSFGCLYPLVGI